MGAHQLACISTSTNLHFYIDFPSILTRAVRHSARLRSIDRVENPIRLPFAPFFGGQNAAGVTDEDMRAASSCAARRPAHSNAEINRELAILRRGYSLAAKTVTVRPTLPNLKEGGTAVGLLRAGAVSRLVCRHLPAAFVPAFRFAYATGWRIHSEVFALPRRPVDFDAEEVRLEPGMTKNSRSAWR